MFFKNRITSIKPDWKVLEVGPGAYPHERANTLLELRYEREDQYYRQCGGKGLSIPDERMVYYDGGRFPFADHAFDYCILAHVIEHINDPCTFLSEVFRVSKRGYIEYPLVYYEYVYYIPEHINIFKMRDGELLYLATSEILRDNESAIRRAWFNSLGLGHTQTLRSLAPLLFEGFEWMQPFRIREASDISEVLLDSPCNIIPVHKESHSQGVRDHLISIATLVRKKITKKLY
jgi:SAM-dependent methyltransferase